MMASPALDATSTASLPGYHSQYLRMDLTRGTGVAVPLPRDVLRRFIGGSGLGVYLMLREGAAAVDPLSPAASIAFVCSPLVGSPLTTSAKFAVVCKSPLTGRINDSLSSSGFAMAAKRTGFDALVLTGRAQRLSIVVVDNGFARLDDATDLAGLRCSETEAVLRDRYGSEFAAAVIGPAGERLVRFASISHDGRHAGRGGSGAVLGSKNIKAIVVRGEKRVNWASPSDLTRLSKELSQKSLGPATAKYRELGTASNLLTFNRLSALPTRNFQQGSFATVEQLAPEALEIDRAKTRSSCAACTIGCEHIYGIRRSDASDTQGERGETVRLEYENLFALGPLCGIDDGDTVLAASKLCDELGMDTISAGGTIAFAMECVERGLLDQPWLTFGNRTALPQVLELIAGRACVGDLLAEGSRRAAERIGHHSLAFAPQVKGLEIPGYEPRSLQTMALGFAVGTRGADHNRSGAYEVDFSERADRRDLQPNTAALARETEDKAAIIDSLILCKFLRGVFSDLFAESAEMLGLVTGWDVTAEELRTTAHRIVAAKKLFNIRAGWQPAEDTLPERFLSQAVGGDAQARLTKGQLEAAVRAYNVGRGWSPDGYLPPETLAALALADV